jgi:FMN phosphatase YigB (HAD superfamily)
VTAGRPRGAESAGARGEDPAHALAPDALAPYGLAPDALAPDALAPHALASMGIRAVSFDLFDTLVDLRIDRIPPLALEGKPRRGTHAELHAVLARHCTLSLAELVAALDATDAALREPYARDGRELATRERFDALLRRLDLAVVGLADELTDVHMATLSRCVEPLAHHAGVLAELAARVRIGVCSNFSHGRTARAILDTCGLRAHLDAIVISEEHGLRKPRPEIFRAVVDALGVRSDETLHVGDRLLDDVAGAAGAGLRTAWLTRRVADPEAERARYPDVAPDVTLTDLRELARCLATADGSGSPPPRATEASG